MKKLKWILLIFVTLSSILGLGVVYWVYQLDQKIAEQLKSKKFLPPTEYFSAPEDFFAHIQMKQPEIEKILQLRNYRQRELDQKLFPGDFVIMEKDSCAKSVSQPLPDDSYGCLQFMIRDVGDPHFLPIPLQMLVFNQQQEIIVTYRGNPLIKSEKAELEPELIAQFIGNEAIMQTQIPLGQIPTQCLNAVLAIEDSQFLEHSGVSYTGIARAAFKNAFGGGLRQGGSTITQQMVKNYFLTNERTLKRKITEFFMSLILETRFTKDQILETYLNIIYLGQDGTFQIRGFSAASQFYFSKPVTELNLGECALLAAVVNGPGVYDPFRKPDNAKKRRGLVLDRMKDLGFISPSEHQLASNQALPLKGKSSVVETAPYYIHAANKELEELAIKTEGIRVFTGLRLKAQQAAQESLRNQLSQLESENKIIKNIKSKGLSLEGSILSVENSTGLVMAVVGGRGYRLTQFNRAIEGHRQVGSIMKPFVYLTALMNSDPNGKIYDPVTLLNDSKFSYSFDRQTWSPENFGKKYYGIVPAYFALKNSLNSATASLGIEVGLEKIIETSRRLGIESDLKRSPSLTLGSFELYPKEVLEAYMTIARFGHHLPISFIRSVTTEAGEVLYKFQPLDENRFDEAQVASLVSMMKQTVQSGTAKSIVLRGFTNPAAGKTGTTSDNKDVWFSGFTPFLTTVVWIGYDNNTPLGLTGASGAVPVWTEYMKSFGVRYPAYDFLWPESSEVISWHDDDGDIQLVFKKNTKRSR